MSSCLASSTHRKCDVGPVPPALCLFVCNKEPDAVSLAVVRIHTKGDTHILEALRPYLTWLLKHLGGGIGREGVLKSYCRRVETINSLTFHFCKGILESLSKGLRTSYFPVAITRYKSHLRIEGLVLAHSLRVHSASGQEAIVAVVGGSWSCCVHSQEAGRDKCPCSADMKSWALTPGVVPSVAEVDLPTSASSIWMTPWPLDDSRFCQVCAINHHISKLAVT